MPPKRRGAQAKSATTAPKPDPPKQQPPSKFTPQVAPAPPAPAPAPAPAPPPPPPEADAAKVRKEWSKFIDAWYEPQRKKLAEKLQKDLLVKYKHLGPPKDTQKQREMELFEKLDAIALQLAQPARAEWERRLELAQLREDQWNDMSGEEQQAVMSVFVGFFADGVEDIDDDDLSAGPSSFEEEEGVVEEPPHRPIHPYPAPVTPAPSRQPIPPTPTRQTFEFVNPTSFFAVNMTPPNPTKNLPALSMDHLATLGPSNPGRSAEPVSAGVNGMFGFHHWASEAGIVTQQPQPQPAKLSAASTSAHSLTARPRATDMSRQASAASTLSSPPLKASSPPYSPPNPTTKFSPQVNTENLPPGKRYIGPVILEEDPDPMDEELLKSKMADEYQQYKISLRIQMIYQFHAEAAEIEIKLFEMLLADEGTKESRARAVQEHETSMMRLREQKEEERKRLCAEEREKRREEIRQHLAQRRSTQSREADPGQKANPPRPAPDKTSVQPRPGKMTHQKENVPLSQPAAASSSKLEPSSILKKSNVSTLSHDEASVNEAFFANAKAMMAQGKAGAAIFTPGQASLNEALFSNAAAMLAAQGQPGGSGKSTVAPPSIMKKSNSSRSQEYDVPQITVSFADTLTPAAAAPVPELPAQVPTTTGKGKKGKKAQLPLSQPVAITEESEMVTDAEPPPLAPSLWDAAAVAAKNAWDVASTSISTSKAKLSASVEEEREPDHGPPLAPSSKGNNASTKKSAPAGKKGKKVTITEEPDVDADPIVAPVPSGKTAKGMTKSAWGSMNGKSKAAPCIAEESEAEPAVLPPAPTPASARGKKGAAEAAAATAKSAQSQKPQLKVAIAEVPESVVEPSPVPAWTTKDKAKAKFAWDVPAATRSTSTQAAHKAAQQQQAESRRGATSASSKSVRVDAVSDLENEWLGTAPAGEISTMPGALSSARPEEGEEDEDEADASAWFNPENMNYWANLMAGPSSPEEKETLAVPVARASTSTTTTAEQTTGKHVRWTPTAGGESDDDDDEGFGEADEQLATSMWMQYAISGGDVPALGGATPEEPHVTPFESSVLQLSGEPSVWEPGRGKKKMHPTAGGEVGNRVQQTSSVFDRAALAGPWPKMESWLSPPSRGQNSGSTRVF